MIVVEKDIAATIKLLYQTGQVFGFCCSASHVTSNRGSRANAPFSVLDKLGFSIVQRFSKDFFHLAEATGALYKLQLSAG